MSASTAGLFFGDCQFNLEQIPDLQTRSGLIFFLPAVRDVPLDEKRNKKVQGRHESSAIRPSLASPNVTAFFLFFTSLRDTLVTITLLFFGWGTCVVYLGLLLRDLKSQRIFYRVINLNSCFQMDWIV